MFRYLRELEALVPTEEDGPFVSFTDLFVGILFLFLILVAALMLMQHAGIQMARKEASSGATESILGARLNSTLAKLLEVINENSQLRDKLKSVTGDQAVNAAAAARHELEQAHATDAAQLALLQGQVSTLTSKLDAIDKLDREHPPFRLAIAYNEYASDSLDRFDRTAPVKFVRSVRIMKSPTGGCIENNFIESANTSWATIDPTRIPTPNNPMSFRGVGECTLTTGGEHYSNADQTVDLKRVSSNLYDGFVTLHVPTGSGSERRDEINRIQYRILGIYDDVFR